MNEEQIKQYYERIEKLLNGANKETYGFAPEEIRQILKCYEYLQQRIDKVIEFNQTIIDGYEKSDMCEYCDGRFAVAEKNLEILKGSDNNV